MIHLKFCIYPGAVQFEHFKTYKTTCGLYILRYFLLASSLSFLVGSWQGAAKNSAAPHPLRGISAAYCPKEKLSPEQGDRK